MFNSCSGGPESDVLQKVNVTVHSKEQCRALYNETYVQLKYGVLDEYMFCAGDTKHDSCQVTMPCYTILHNLT